MALNIKDQAIEIRSHSSSTHSVLAKRKLLLYAHILSIIADWPTVVLQIGINYIHQESQLEGCINDAEIIKAFLIGKLTTTKVTCVRLIPLQNALDIGNKIL